MVVVFLPIIIPLNWTRLWQITDAGNKPWSSNGQYVPALCYYFSKAKLDFISGDRCICICLRWEELVFLIELVVISAEHSVLVQNWNCRELLCASPELVLVFYWLNLNGQNWYWYFLVSKSRQYPTLPRLGVPLFAHSFKNS